MIRANIARIRERVMAAATRAGRDPQGIVVVAAAKRQSAASVEEAIAAGITDIGENYVQEAAAKRREIHRPARWHLIGHLQRNKVARAVELFDVIQTVDTAALAAALALHIPSGRKARVLIEVNLGAEPDKTGVAPESLAQLLDVLRGLPALAVEGLMAIPPQGPPDATRPYFRRLRALRDQYGLSELSMGMSDDFEVAIEEGATIVRIGRALFGQRPKK